MQRAHTCCNQKSFLIIWIVISFSLIACSNKKNKQTNFFLNQFEDGFNESSEAIREVNSAIYESIKMNKSDPFLRDDAVVAIRKADSIDAVIGRILNLISSQKQKLYSSEKISRDNWAHLFTSIKKTYAELMLIDSSFNLISKNKPLRCQRMDAVDLNLLNQNITDADAEYQNVLLSNLSNDLLLDKNDLFNYIRRQMKIQRRCLFKSPIVAVSSSVITEGDSVEFTAGVGYFEFFEKNKAVINNDTVYATNKGLMKYTFRPKNGKGKHTVPVTLYYADDDGNEVVSQTNVNITIK